MALITDPDDLNQTEAGSTISDASLTTPTGTQVFINSSGNIPAGAAVGDYVRITGFASPENNGLWKVETVTDATNTLVIDKQTGAAPTTVGSTSITWMDDLEVFIDTNARNIFLFQQGNLSSDGVTLQAFYSFLKEEWKADAELIKHPFPMVAITPEQFEFVSDWEPDGSLTSGTDETFTKQLIRTGGWSEVDQNSVVKRQYTGVITLGTFEDNLNDNAYYVKGDDPTTDLSTNFKFPGPVNEPILTFEELSASANAQNFASTNTITRGTGSWITDGFVVGGQVVVRASETPANDGTFTLTDVTASTLTLSGTPLTASGEDDTARLGHSFRNALDVFLRVRDADPNGKSYAQADLASIGVTELTNKVERFPLSNATDLKISATDATISTTSPWNQIEIRYFSSPFSQTITNLEDFGIVIDVGTHSGIDGSVTAAGAQLDTAEGSVPQTTYDGGTLTIHETSVSGDYTIGTVPASGTAVPITTTFSATQPDLSFTLQRSTPVSATTQEIYEKVQYLLRQSTDIDSTTNTVVGNSADELLEFVGDTLRAGSSAPTNPNGGGSGVAILGFDSNDTNNLVFFNNSETSTTFPFVAAGTISFNQNLVGDTNPEYFMFFRYTERISNTGFGLSSAATNTAQLDSSTTDLTTVIADNDYIALSGFTNEDNNGVFRVNGTVNTGDAQLIKTNNDTLVNEAAGATVNLDLNPIDSPDAIIVNNNSGSQITGTVGASSISFDFDYDGNVQGGRTAGNDAAIIIRAIGLEQAQFVETTGTITQNTGLTFSLVAALERNYENPA